MIDINELRFAAAKSTRDLALLPSEVNELLDRLEAAEKERDEVAQQLVQSEIGKREISEAHNAVTRQLSVLADENTALRAKIERMGTALGSLLIRCDDSDSAMYGTLSTSFVRDTVRIARAALEESK